MDAITLKDILYIIDMDIFLISNNFVCKKLAYIETSTTGRIKYTFKVGNFFQLSYLDKMEAIYCKNFIHGLKFKDNNNNNDLKQCELIRI